MIQPSYVELCDDGMIRMIFEKSGENVNVALTPETALDLSMSITEALDKLPKETRQALYEKAMQEYLKHLRLRENTVTGGLVGQS
jgi:hypothetical protein